MNPLRKINLKSPFTIFIILFIGINLIWIFAPSVQRETLPAGSSAPDFELPDVFNLSSRIKLSNLVEKRNVVLIFWSTYCPACRREMVAISNSIEEITAGDAEVVSVNVDYDDIRVVREFLRSIGGVRKFVNLVDVEGVAGLYKVSSLPSVYVIGKNGKICYATSGYTTTGELKKVIRKCSL